MLEISTLVSINFSTDLIPEESAFFITSKIKFVWSCSNFCAATIEIIAA